MTIEAPLAEGGKPWTLRAANPDASTPELLLATSTGGGSPGGAYHATLGIWSWGDRDAPRKIHTTPANVTVAESAAISDQYVIWVETHVQIGEQGARLMLMRRDSGRIEEIASTQRATGPAAYLFVLRNGILAYVKIVEGREHLILRDLTGGSERTIAASPEGSNMRPLDIAAEKALWAAKNDAHGRYEIFLTEISGATSNATFVIIDDQSIDAEFGSNESFYIRGRRGIWRIDPSPSDPQLIWNAPSGEVGYSILVRGGRWIAWNARQEGAVVVLDSASGGLSMTAETGTIHIAATRDSLVWQHNPTMTGRPPERLLLSHLQAP